MISIIRPRRNHLLNIRWMPPTDQPSLYPTGSEATLTPNGGTASDLLILIDKRPVLFAKISDMSKAITFVVNLNAVNRVFDITAVVLKSFSHYHSPESENKSLLGNLTSFPLHPSHDWTDKVDRIAGRPILFQESVTIDTTKDPASCEVFSKSAKIKPIFEWAGYLDDGIEAIDVSELAHTWKQMKPFYWDDLFIVAVTFDEIVMMDSASPSVMWGDNLLTRCPCFKYHGDWTGKKRETVPKCPFYEAPTVTNFTGGPSSTCVAYSHVPVFLDASGISYTIGRSVDGGVFNQTGPFDVSFTLPFNQGDDAGDVNRYILYRTYNSYPAESTNSAASFTAGGGFLAELDSTEERAFPAFTYIPALSGVFVAGGTHYTDVGEEVHSSAEMFMVGKVGMWVDMGSMSVERKGAVAVYVEDVDPKASNGKVYVIGGRNEEAFEIATVDVCDLDTNGWSTVSSTNTSYYGHAAVFLPNSRKIFVIGDNNVELYDIATDTWTALDELSVGIRFMSANYVTGTDGDGHDHDLVLVTGGVNTQGDSVDTAMCFDIDSVTGDYYWHDSVPPLGVPRHGHASASFDSDTQVFIVGGFEGTDTYVALTDSPYTRSVEIYEFDSGTWTWSTSTAADTEVISPAIMACSISNTKILVVGRDRYQVFDSGLGWGIAAVTALSNDNNFGYLVGMGSDTAFVGGGTKNIGWNIGKLADVNLPPPPPDLTDLQYRDKDNFGSTMRHIPPGWEGYENLPGYTDIVYFPETRGYGDDCEDTMSLVFCGGDPLHGSGGTMVCPIALGSEKSLVWDGTRMVESTSSKQTVVDFFSTANAASGRFDDRFTPTELLGYVSTNVSTDPNSRWITLDQDLSGTYSLTDLSGQYLVLKHEWEIAANESTKLLNLFPVKGTSTPNLPVKDSAPVRFFVESHQSRWYEAFDYVYSDTGMWNDLTSAAYNYTLGPVNLFGSVTDIFYIGSDSTFSYFYTWFANPYQDYGLGDVGLVVEYYDSVALGWVALGPGDLFVDGTNGLVEGGATTFVPPANWGKTNVNATLAYWLRLTITLVVVPPLAFSPITIYSVTPCPPSDARRVYTGYGAYSSSQNKFVAPEAEWEAGEFANVYPAPAPYGTKIKVQLPTGVGAVVLGGISWTDTSASWVEDHWVNYTVTDSTGAQATIYSNTSDTLMVDLLLTNGTYTITPAGDAAQTYRLVAYTAYQIAKAETVAGPFTQLRVFSSALNQTDSTQKEWYNIISGQYGYSNTGTVGSASYVGTGGVASVGTPYTWTDAAATWLTDQWKGFTIEDELAGTATVLSNDATTLYVDALLNSGKVGDYTIYNNSLQKITINSYLYPYWPTGVLIHNTANITDSSGNNYEKVITFNGPDWFLVRSYSETNEPIHLLNVGACSFVINTCNIYMTLVSDLMAGRDTTIALSTVHPQEMVEEGITYFAMSSPEEELVSLSSVGEDYGNNMYKVHFDREYAPFDYVIVSGSDQSMYARADDGYSFVLLVGIKPTYVGSVRPFSSLWIDVESPMDATGTVVYSYFDGTNSVWTPVNNLLDETIDYDKLTNGWTGTAQLTRSGIVSFDIPSNWGKGDPAALGYGDFYWLQIKKGKGAVTNAPYVNVTALANLHTDIYPMMSHPVGSTAINISPRGDRESLFPGTLLDPTVIEYHQHQHMGYTRANRYNDPFCNRFRYVVS